MNTDPRTFSARYRAGLFFAPGPGCLVAPLLYAIAAAVTRNYVTAAAVAVAAFLIATLLWTERRKREPALVLGRAGMRIEGLSLTPWSEIAGVRRAADAAGNAALEIALRGRAPKMLRSPLWRPSPEGILIHTSLLEDSAEAIEEAFRFFLQNR
ncbi:MAG: hypothetical protein AB7M12_09655 [Hyphomonadaceae bacterium]